MDAISASHARPISLHGRDLCVERGNLRVCDRLSFVLQAGTLLEVLGRNGAGKTSLLRVIAGLSKPVSGQLSWHGVADSQAPSMTYIAHKPAVKNSLTVRQNLSDYARLHGQYDEAAVQHALNAFGLLPWADVLCAEISEGQRRKIALSRLLVEGSILWILDEPTASLDQAGADYLAAMIDRHLQAHGLAVIARHRDMLPACMKRQTIRLSSRLMEPIGAARH